MVQGGRGVGLRGEDVGRTDRGRANNPRPRMQGYTFEGCRLDLPAKNSQNKMIKYQHYHFFKLFNNVNCT